MKKILLVLILLVMGAIVAASFAVRQAPEWLREALEGALGKSVSIRAIDFQFPTTFILSGVRISEKDGLFAGEPEFTAETVRLSAVPTSLRGRQLVIDEIEVRDAAIVVRRSGGKLYHVLSSKPSKTEPVADASTDAKPSTERQLSISLFRLENGLFQFHDFDTGDQGFVFDCDAIQARLAGFQVPLSKKKTAYSVEGRLLQGRGEKSAAFQLSGSTSFSTLDTDAKAELHDLHLTYFQPYVSKVTTAVIEEGYLEARAQAVIREKHLSVDADLALTSLFFESLEGSDQLFGLSAKEILDFVKDSSGRLKIPVSVRWNFGDRSVSLRAAVRDSIEVSLKRTVFGNVGSILEQAILRIGEKGVDVPEKTTETVLKKIKDFLKY